MTIVLYGIPNCDTVRKARGWLADADRDVRFHDFKKDGVPDARLGVWLRAAGWERLLNHKGTAWRQLDEAERAQVVDADSAARVMRAHPSTIKRPVVEWPDGAITVGFDAADWSRR